MKKFLRDNLPWIAPSAAIVLAASGAFDRSGGSNSFDDALSVVGDTTEAVWETVQSAVTPEAGVAAQAATAPVVAATVVPNPAPAPVPQVAPVQVASVPVVAQPPVAAPAVPVEDVQPVKAIIPQPQVQQVAPAPVVPAPVVPARAEPTVVPQQDVGNAAAFFQAAQEKLASERSCVEDIRTLAADARVYFPSGGLAGEESGLMQARLLGVLVRDCPGVTIQVEGHSDPSGLSSTNLRLSKERAEAVIARISASGVDTSRFVARGFGDARPSSVTGPEPRSFYDRRVEFTVIEARRPSTGFSGPNGAVWSASTPACVARLQQAVQRTRIFYNPGSVIVSPDDMRSVYDLADQAVNCPEARLRVVGQHADQFGQVETPSTGRLRAIALMSSLVGAGYDSGQIILAAPSDSKGIPGQPGISNARVDFDVILEDG